MLRLPLQVTHGLLSHPIVAYDTSYARNQYGEVTRVVEADRTIIGNLQPAGDRVLKLLPEGAQADGAMVLHTTAPVFAAGNAQGAIESRQTYLKHNGNTWKLWMGQDWNPHSGISRWIATLYIEVAT